MFLSNWLLCSVLSTVLIYFFVCCESGESKQWKQNNGILKYGNKVPMNTLFTSKKDVRKRIVLYHNFFRTRVQPTATNMLQMRWHEGAARNSQSWASACRALTHDPASARRQPLLGQCGQNIFVSTHRVPWFFALQNWFDERRNFTYGAHEGVNSISVIGHYTQMVWAPTHRVGCGFAYCPQGGFHGRPFYNYVCNYCPAGNWENKISTPYESGPSCSRCRGSCAQKALCTNKCSRADVFSNCGSMVAQYGRANVCNARQSDTCAATCQCPGRIHEWMNL